MLSPSLIVTVEQIIRSRIIRHQPVSGGSINAAFKISTSTRTYFLKYNDAKRFPGMFEAEAKGLKILHSANTFVIPEVVQTGAADGKSFLILQWMESGIRKKFFWNDFGMRLANLHRNTNENFGFDHDNYIGSLPQFNRRQNSWNQFFISERLEPLLKMAIDDHKFDKGMIGRLNSLSNRLPEMIPEEKPSLIHGDLWNGNFMIAPDGSACLMDPAVYYGHREMDLAMTRLFGGFDPEFYECYQASFPLEKGFDSRVDIHNLYPLLVHVNLFGGGYIEQVKSILSRF